MPSVSRAFPLSPPNTSRAALWGSDHTLCGEGGGTWLEDSVVASALWPKGVWPWLRLSVSSSLSFLICQHGGFELYSF